MASETHNTSMDQTLQTRVLPKNYRQIGDPGNKKIYIEDYVYTYLNKLSRPGNIYARGAILFGKIYKTENGKCLFISGACACQNFEFDLEHTTLTEENWKEIYRIRDEYFKEQEVMGWFLSRMGFSVELNDKIIRAHVDNFGGENKVLYMIDALEDEDAFYQFENYSLKKQNGYYIYYESNESMKNYMLSEKNIESSEEKQSKKKALGRDAAVINNYKKLLKQKKAKKPKETLRWRPTSTVGAAIMLLVIFYGAYSIKQFQNNYNSKETFGVQESTFSEEEWTIPEEENTSVFEETYDETNTQEELESQQFEKEISTQVLEEEMNETDTKAVENDTADTSADTSSEENTFQSQDTFGSSGEVNQDIFTQEEPDDSKEAWSYIGNYYTVQKGDTLAGISRKIFQSYDYIIKIAEENGIVNINQIYPGQILYIPQMED